MAVVFYYSDNNFLLDYLSYSILFNYYYCLFYEYIFNALYFPANTYGRVEKYTINSSMLYSSSVFSWDKIWRRKYTSIVSLVVLYSNKAHSAGAIFLVIFSWYDDVTTIPLGLVANNNAMKFFFLLRLLWRLENNHFLAFLIMVQSTLTLHCLFVIRRWRDYHDIYDNDATTATTRNSYPCIFAYDVFDGEPTFFPYQTFLFETQGIISGETTTVILVYSICRQRDYCTMARILSRRLNSSSPPAGEYLL
jgi:hypothetical protein